MSKIGHVLDYESEIYFRETEQELLSQLFKPLLKYPDSWRSVKVSITGDSSSGKTALIKNFFQRVMNYSENNNLNIKCIQVNCRKYRNIRLIIYQIIRKFTSFQLPLRGFDSFEYMMHLTSKLDENKIKLIIALDDFDYLLTHNFNNAIDILNQLDDTNISVIIACRDFQFRDKLPAELNVGFLFKLKKYNFSELQYILQMKLEERFSENQFSLDVIRFITELIYTNHNSDINFGIDLLQQSLINFDINDDEVSLSNILQSEKNPHKISVQDIVRVYPKFLLQKKLDDVFILNEKFKKRIYEIAKKLKMNNRISLNRNELELSENELAFLLNDGFLYRHSDSTFSFLFATLEDLINALTPGGCD